MNFNINIPEKLSEENWRTHFNDDLAKVKELDAHNLLKQNNIMDLAYILGVIEEVAPNTSYSLIHVEPQTALGNGIETFKISHMLALQNIMPYLAVEIFNPIDSLVARYNVNLGKTSLKKELKSLGIDYNGFIQELEKKSIVRPMSRKDDPHFASLLFEKINQYAEKEISENRLPVNFSTHLFGNEINLDNRSLMTRGLHIHMYSNPDLKEILEDTVSYTKVKEIYVTEDKSERRKMIFENVVKLRLPETKVRFLQNPWNDYSDFVVYKVD